jgi:hypothetical protein
MRPALTTSSLSLLLLLAASGAACGGASTASGGGSKSQLPPYSGHAVELFDDTIEPGAAGLELDEGTAPAADPVLRERTQVSDAVARVKVTTVTSKREDTGTSYQLSMRLLEVLTGKNPPPPEFTVTIPQGSPSEGIMKNQGQTFVDTGKTFLCFVRAFARADGDTDLHFHIAPDQADELKAVRDAAAQQELR